MLDDSLEEKHKAERKAPSREWYEQLISLRQRLARAYPGKVFEDSTEIIRQMREERDQHLERLLHPGHK